MLGVFDGGLGVGVVVKAVAYKAKPVSRRIIFLASLNDDSVSSLDVKAVRCKSVRPKWPYAAVAVAVVTVSSTSAGFLSSSVAVRAPAASTAATAGRSYRGPAAAFPPTRPAWRGAAMTPEIQRLKTLLGDSYEG